MGVAGDEDNLVLDCYWLARWYHQSPEIFLNMPLSDVRMHVLRTMQMAQLMQQRGERDDGE